jgi:hypothetical protein
VIDEHEAEGAQLVVRPEKALTGLTAAAGELRSESGASLPADAIKVLRVGYVNVEIASDETGGTGYWPDPLPPFNGGVSVAAGENQPLWVRVKAPANTAPGLYRGQITVNAEGFTATVPLEVEVYGFSLPDATTCRTLFGLDAGRVWKYQSDQRLKLFVRQSLAFLSRWSAGSDALSPPSGSRETPNPFGRRAIKRNAISASILTSTFGSFRPSSI